MVKFKDTITNDELALLPIGQFEGDIIVVDSELGLTEACNYLLTQPIIGFDTETKPAFKAGVINKVALLQLSTQDRCYLFRLCSIRLDKAIIKILESKNIIKIGVDIKGDLRGMQQLRRFRPGGFIDLQSVVGSYGINELSVRKMAAIVLSLRVSKAQRLSNWEAVEFTPAQKLYAATDAWVSLSIYNKLISTK